MNELEAKLKCYMAFYDWVSEHLYDAKFSDSMLLRKIAQAEGVANEMLSRLGGHTPNWAPGGGD